MSILRSDAIGKFSFRMSRPIWLGVGLGELKPSKAAPDGLSPPLPSKIIYVGYGKLMLSSVLVLSKINWGVDFFWNWGG